MANQPYSSSQAVVQTFCCWPAGPILRSVSISIHKGGKPSGNSHKHNKRPFLQMGNKSSQVQLKDSLCMKQPCLDNDITSSETAYCMMDGPTVRSYLCVSTCCIGWILPDEERLATHSILVVSTTESQRVTDQSRSEDQCSFEIHGCILLEGWIVLENIKTKLHLYKAILLFPLLWALKCLL